MKERLLITGGSGLLGSTAASMALADFEVWATYNSRVSEIAGCKFIQLDIRDHSRVMSLIKDVRPNLIIHTAALSAPDYCEDHPEETWETNVKGTENIILASKEVGAKLIYISTDAVFDGGKGMYLEEDTPQPLNTYSKTKLEGESRIRYLLPDSIIVRTSGIYGRSLHGKRSLSEWIIAELREGNTLDMANDAFFSPTLVNNLVEVLLEMYNRNLSGIYHVAGREGCSKYDFAQELARAFGLNTTNVQPSTRDQIKLSAARPRDSSLDVSKVFKEIDTRLLGVKDGIALFRQLEK